MFSISALLFGDKQDLEIPLEFEVSGLNLPTICEGDSVLYFAADGYAPATVLEIEWSADCGIEGEWLVRIEFISEFDGLTIRTWTSLSAVQAVLS